MLALGQTSLTLLSPLLKPKNGTPEPLPRTLRHRTRKASSTHSHPIRGTSRSGIVTAVRFPSPSLPNRNVCLQHCLCHRWPIVVTAAPICPEATLARTRDANRAPHPLLQTASDGCPITSIVRRTALHQQALKAFKVEHQEVVRKVSLLNSAAMRPSCASSGHVPTANAEKRSVIRARRAEAVSSTTKEI
jgi:hypothetical protein